MQLTAPTGALERLLVALLVGLLIGLDRERTEARKARRLFAGVRTFPLIALAGAVPMLLFDLTGPGLLVVSFTAVTAIALVSYIRGSAAGDVGATTEVAAVATFLLGAMAGAGQLLVAGAAGVGVAVLLVAKPPLEAFSHALTTEELAAVLELAVISVIVLPLAPNRGYGPWQVWNPFEIWLVVVLVSALSFAGFMAMRLWGERQGLVIAGVVGALVSSTAVTMAMAIHSRAGKQIARAAASVVVLASTVMCVRVAVLTGSLNPDVLPRLVPVVAVMGLAGLVAAWLLRRRDAEPAGGAAEPRISNPFSLTAALTFGVVYALVRLIVHAAHLYSGTGGMYVAAAVSALADVDAVSIAIVRGGPVHGGWQVPAAAVTIAVVTNTVVKLGIAVVAGGGRFRRYVGAALGITVVLGALAGAAVYVSF